MGDDGALRVSIDLRIPKTFVTAERGLVAAESSPSSQCSTTAGWSAAMVTLSANVRLYLSTSWIVTVGADWRRSSHWNANRISWCSSANCLRPAVLVYLHCRHTDETPLGLSNNFVATLPRRETWTSRETWDHTRAEPANEWLHIGTCHFIEDGWWWWCWWWSFMVPAGQATSRTALGGSWVLNFHHWWYSPSKQSPTCLH